LYGFFDLTDIATTPHLHRYRGCQPKLLYLFFWVAIMLPLAAVCLALLACCTAQTAGAFVTYDQLGGIPYNVSWDSRSFMINGQRTLLLGGSFHYPRASPGDWPTIFQNAKADGLNHIQSYVFWFGAVLGGVT
jgi:hypothetical protein